MLTKTRRLEIENQVLRETLENIRKDLEELDRTPLGERYSGRGVSRFLGYLTAELGHVEDALKSKLESEEWRSRKTKNPGSSYKPGKIEKATRVSSL